VPRNLNFRVCIPRGEFAETSGNAHFDSRRAVVTVKFSWRIFAPRKAWELTPWRQPVAGPSWNA
jgi:hypothetical protein